MKNSRKVIVPAIILAVAASVLILYAVFGLQNDRPPGRNGITSASAPGEIQGYQQGNLNSCLGLAVLTADQREYIRLWARLPSSWLL